MKKTIYLLAIVATLLNACDSSSNKDSSQEKPLIDTQDQATVDNDNTVRSTRATLIIDGYLALKNALTEDNSELAGKAGQMIIDAFVKFDKSDLSDEQLSEVNQIVESANAKAQNVADNASDMDNQRTQFELMSADITNLIAIVGTDRKLYQDFCPMYNDNKGGYWLSESKEIKNPFFGSMMLTCGSVKKEIEVK